MSTNAVLQGLNQSIGAVDGFAREEPRLFMWGLGETAGWLNHAGLISGAASKSLDFAGDAFSTLDAFRAAVQVKKDFADLASGVSSSKVRKLAADVANCVSEGASALRFYVEAKVIVLGELGAKINIAGHICQIANAINALFDNVMVLRNHTPFLNVESTCALSAYQGTRIAFSGYMLNSLAFGGGPLNPVVMQALLSSMFGTLVWNYRVS